MAFVSDWIAGSKHGDGLTSLLGFSDVVIMQKISSLRTVSMTFFSNCQSSVRGTQSSRLEESMRTYAQHRPTGYS